MDFTIYHIYYVLTFKSDSLLIARFMFYVNFKTTCLSIFGIEALIMRIQY